MSSVASLKPLYVQLRDELRTQILDGRLKALARLPSEAELTERYAVSRITVRQALNDLHKEGLIVKVHGKGTFVSQPKVAQDVTRLKGLAEAMFGEGHDVHNRTLSLKDVAASVEVAERLAVPAKSPVTEIKSLRYLDRQPISVDVSYVPRQVGDRLKKLDLPARDIIDIYESDLGLAIGYAELMIEATSADKTQAKLLRIEPGAPILHIQRVIYTSDDRPLHFDSVSYRGDAFRYRLRTERGRR
jgi:GntR family transcriptional regulator